jgi:hypothetical protein
MTTPRLTSDGMHIEGWVRPPADGVWRPSDLLWLPPSATKSTDIDGIGRIVDVKDFEIGDCDWVTAQLNKRERYLESIRAKVRAGAFRLTAALARTLGMPWDEDAAQLVPRTGTGTVAYRALATAKTEPKAHARWCYSTWDAGCPCGGPSRRVI